LASLHYLLHSDSSYNIPNLEAFHKEEYKNKQTSSNPSITFIEEKPKNNASPNKNLAPKNSMLSLQQSLKNSFQSTIEKNLVSLFAKAFVVNSLPYSLADDDLMKKTY